MAAHEVDEQEYKGGQLEDDRYDDDLFSYNLRILNNDGVDDGVTTCSSMWDGYSTHSAVVQEARERSWRCRRSSLPPAHRPRESCGRRQLS